MLKLLLSIDLIASGRLREQENKQDQSDDDYDCCGCGHDGPVYEVTLSLFLHIYIIFIDQYSVYKVIDLVIVWDICQSEKTNALI